MNPKVPLRIPAHLDVLPFKSAAFDLNWVECAHCREHMELHQPDQNSPEKLLGICVGCRRWYLLLLVPDDSGAILVLLPDGEWMYAASQKLGPPAGAGLPEV